VIGLPIPVLLAIIAAAAGVVVVAGVVLARSGDQLAERTGLGGMVVGLLLLAGATSLPEVATDVSASLAGAPDLAVGDLFGSSMANMAILALIDLLHRGRVWPSVSLGHARGATLAIALTSLAVLGVLAPPGIAIGWVGIETIIIAGGYIATILWIRRSPTTTHRRGPAGVAEPERPTVWGTAPKEVRPLRAEAIRFGLASLAVLLAAPTLALAAQALAEATGVGQSFIGALLLGVATSLPELAASIAAVRIGAFDLAVGNLFGSNAFNMTALLAADIAYFPGPILAAVHPSQVVAGVGGILMMALALSAVVHGERTRVWRLEPDALLVLVVWVFLLAAVFVTGSAAAT
jgi:cation:H+ antiporter